MMKFLPLIPILFLATTNISAQRCGDSLLIYLRDQNGQVIAPSAFESVKVSATYTVDNVTNLIDAEPTINELVHGVKSFAVRAECGMKLAQFQLKYKGDEMTIRVLNVPGDAQHILLERILFEPGKFEVDLGGRPLQNVETYQGAESKADDPANEIKWSIKDNALKKVG
jgi:hypothetical protein